jgi:hypothetical protein
MSATHRRPERRAHPKDSNLQDEVPGTQLKVAGKLDCEVGYAVPVCVAQNHGLAWIACVYPEFPGLVAESRCADEAEGLVATCPAVGIYA